MSPEVARKLRDHARAFPSKPRSSDAAAFVRAWLRVEGMQLDRWSNWKRPGVDDKRYQLTDKVLREQYRNPKGEWINRESQSLIDAAYDLLGQAAVVLEDSELSGRVLKETGKRKDVQETQRSRVAERERLQLANELAWREVASMQRDDVLRGLQGQLPAAERTKIDEFRQVLTDKYLELLGSGADPTDIDVGGRAASVAAPPVLPLRVDTSYIWTETDSATGTTFPVYLYRGTYGRLHVHIGWGAGARWSERPGPLIKSWLDVQREVRNVTPARLHGMIQLLDDPGTDFRAELETLGVRPGAEPSRGQLAQGGLGPLLRDLKQAIYLWCTLLEGYNIRWFQYDRALYSWAGEAAMRELEATGAVSVHEVGEQHMMSWNRITR